MGFLPTKQVDEADKNTINCQNIEVVNFRTLATCYMQLCCNNLLDTTKITKFKILILK